MSTTEKTEVENGLPEDIFNREKIAGQMCDIIVNMKANDISPLVLDGPWGCGKSIHALRMYDVFTKKYGDKIKCLYWNASSSDYSEHPLLTFVSLLFQHVDVNKKKDFEKKGLDICLGIGLGGLTSIFRQAVTITTGIDPAKVGQDAAAGANLFKSDDKKLYESFSKMLNNLAYEKERIDAAQVLLNLVREDKELIIIIDELDRCRPDFALKILECIKHLFTTANSKFILVMNKEAMAASVEHMYGLKEEAAFRYLDKYITDTYKLPEIQSYGESCPIRYFWYLTKHLPLKNELTDNFLEYLINNEGMTLRDIEKLAHKVNYIVNQNQIVFNYYMDTHKQLLAIFTAHLFTHWHDLAQLIATKAISNKEALDKIGWSSSFLTISSDTEEPYLAYLKSFLTFHLGSSEEKQRICHKYENNHEYRKLSALSLSFNQWMLRATFMDFS